MIFPRAASALAVLLSVGLLGWGCKKGNTDGPSADVSTLIATLDTADGDAKLNALAELGKAGPAALPALKKVIPMLSDPDPLIRRTAAYVLEQIGPPAKEAVPALEEAMKDASTDVMMAVSRALEAIEPSRAQK
jgi:HEAT repeat protein